jgi:hypothetical protein
VQWVLRSHEALDNVGVEVAGLDSNSKVVPQVRSVGYVVVAKSTVETPTSEIIHRAPALFPDVLYEKFPIAMQADETQAIWITLSIPRDATPGDCRGQLILKIRGVEKARDSFTLRIIPAAVPAEQTLNITNWFYLSDRWLRGPYKVKQLTDDWWNVLSNIGRVMADHRQTMISTPLTGFYFTQLALIDAHAGPNGIEYDFKNFDRWVDTFQKAGIRSIESSHILRREENADIFVGDAPADLSVDAYVLKDGNAVLQALPINDPQTEPALRSMLTAFYQHLQEKGWIEIYYQHILDEVRPDEMLTYQKYAAIVQDVMPRVRTMDAVTASKDMDIYEKSCKVWVPILGSFDDMVPRLHEHVKKSGELWFYTCLVNTGMYPNRFIDYALIKTQMLQWINFRYDLTGFLHWGGNYWNADPIHNTQTELGHYWGANMVSAGDSFIVYPDQENKSIFRSIRLEAMREGIEDYELLRVLEKQNPIAAHALAEKTVRTFTDYVRDPAEFREIQRKLYQEVSAN